MTEIISVSLRKGGSGKTTTAVNVAAGLQLRGKRTLLVDLDDQANATMCVGLNPFELERSITTLLTDIAVQPSDVILQTEYGLSVLPATQDLEEVGAGMNATSITSLKPIFADLNDAFDYIILDTQPGHSYLSLSALVASHHVLIPMQAHYLAMEGVARIMDDIRRVQHGDVNHSKRGLNPELGVIGIVPCMVQNTNAAQVIMEKTKEDYPGLVLPMEIRLSVNFVSASIVGSPMVVSEPNHAGSRAYMELVDLLIEKTGA